MRTLPLAFAIACTCAPGRPTAIPSGLKSPFTGYTSPRYADPNQWLCLPGRADACSEPLTATEIRADGTRAIVHESRAASPAVDCFYVYPTVDMGIAPGNHDDFHDIAPMARTAFAQAARFTEACAVYAPLYRQVTIGTYAKSAEGREPFMKTAFSDVADAFLHYMGQHNRGRKIVLLGHSQGADMVVRLLRRFFDDDPAMRERLLLAMPIGWHVEVPLGKTKGATFSNLEACTRAEQTGCVVAYRSYSADDADIDPRDALPKPGDVSVCVNPAEIDGAARPFSRTYFPLGPRLREYVHGVEGITTPFVLLRDFYSGTCVSGANGFRYLAIRETRAPGDQRTSPFDLAKANIGKLGLHILDYQFTQGDLVDMVARRAAKLPAPRGD